MTQKPQGLPSLQHISGQEQEAESWRPDSASRRGPPECLIQHPWCPGPTRTRGRSQLQCQTQQQTVPREGATTAAMNRADWRNDLSATSAWRTKAKLKQLTDGSDSRPSTTTGWTTSASNYNFSSHGKYIYHQTCLMDLDFLIFSLLPMWFFGGFCCGFWFDFFFFNHPQTPENYPQEIFLHYCFLEHVWQDQMCQSGH